MKALVFAACMTAMCIGGAFVIYALSGAIVGWFANLSDRGRAVVLYGAVVAALFGFFLAVGLRA
jgi:hypothetical protein